MFLGTWNFVGFFWLGGFCAVGCLFIVGCGLVCRNWFLVVYLTCLAGF